MQIYAISKYANESYALTKGGRDQSSLLVALFEQISPIKAKTIPYLLLNNYESSLLMHHISEKSSRNLENASYL